MGYLVTKTGVIVWEEMKGTDMVICCVDLRYGHNHREWLIFIPHAHYINFEATFPCHLIPMKACNSTFIREVNGTLL